MKAVLLEGFGGVEVLKVGVAEKPAPKENEVLVRVMATSVNRPDLVQREGKYPPPPGDSEILGLEVAGVIEALGANVSGWRVGDRVTAEGRFFVNTQDEHRVEIKRVNRLVVRGLAAPGGAP